MAMDTDPFTRLSEQERAELALCGITTAEQLALLDIEKVLEDLERARAFFPEKEFSINKARLESIHLLCTPAKVSEQLSGEKELFIENVGPTTGFRNGGRRNRQVKEQALKGEHQRQILHSPIRSNHPVLTFFGALSTSLLIIPILSVFVIPVLLMTGNLPAIPLPVLAALCVVVPSLPYMVYARLVTCPVCHIRVFTFSHYVRNRFAHFSPLFGYNISTALHIIFCRSYNCPGCGTPVMIKGSKGRKIHH